LLSSWSLDTFALQTSLPGLSLSSLPNAAGLPPTTLVFNPNGDILVASDYLDPVRLWDINNQTELYTLTASSDIAFSPDGQTLATVNKWAEGKVILWDIKSGQRLKTLSNETVEPVTSIAFSPNGRTLAMGGCIRADDSSCETGVVYLLDIGAGQLGSTPLIHPTPSLEDPIHTIAFHADGQTLISANYFDVILWDLDTGKPTSLPLGESQWVSAIALNSQDTLLAVATGSVITLWDPSTGKQVGQPFQGHTKTIKSVDFGLDGAILASTAFDEVNAGGETFLWQVSSRKRIGNSLNARNGTAIAFHPDGHLIAGVFEYDGLVLWDMRLDSWQEQACVLANRNLTQDEWEQFMGSGIEYRPSCPVKLPHRVFKF